MVVYVHNRTSKNTDELELVYTVHVGGKPVLAVAAAEDMKLVSNTEVTAELGYPVITKAERKYYTVNYKGIYFSLVCITGQRGKHEQYHQYNNLIRILFLFLLIPSSIVCSLV